MLVAPLFMPAATGALLQPHVRELVDLPLLVRFCSLQLPPVYSRAALNSFRVPFFCLCAGKYDIEKKITKTVHLCAMLHILIRNKVLLNDVLKMCLPEQHVAFALRTVL